MMIYPNRLRKEERERGVYDAHISSIANLALKSKGTVEMCDIREREREERERERERERSMHMGYVNMRSDGMLTLCFLLKKKVTKSALCTTYIEIEFEK